MLRKQFATYLLHQKRYSTNTVNAYNKDLDQLYHFLFLTFQFNIDQVDDIKKLNINHLRSWIADLAEKNIEAKSITRKLSSVKTFFKYLFEAVEFPDDFAGKRDRLILELLYLTGMRRAELIELTTSDINFSSENVHVTGKGNKQRLIPLHPGILSFIQSYITLRASTFSEINHPFLLCTNAGKKLYPKFAYNTVKKYLSLITTLEKKSPHILRHTFATHMMNNGADLNAIKTLLGHASLASTQVYTHNSIEQLKEIYKKAHPKS